MDYQKELKILNKGKSVKIRCYFKKPTKWLYLDYYSDGVRNYHFPKMALVGDDTKDKQTIRIVSKIRDDYEYKLMYQDTGLEIFNHAKDTTKLIEFTLSCTKHMLPRTKEFYLSGVNSLVKFKDDLPLSRYNKANISAWIEALTVEPVTKHNYLRAVKRIFNQAVKEKIVKENPCLDVQCKFSETKRQFLTIEEIQRVNEVVFDMPVIKDAFIFSCYTGLRLGDVRTLRWGNIVNGYLEYTQHKTGHVARTKLNHTALSIVERQQRPSPFVFMLPAKKSFYIHFKRFIALAQLDKRITFHCGRHTFATLLLTSGCSIYTVSKLLGHKNISTTEVYLNLIDQVKDDAIDKLPDL